MRCLFSRSLSGTHSSFWSDEVLAGWLHGASRRLAPAGSGPEHAVARGSDSNGDAFSLDGLDDRLRAERTLLQPAASGHKGRNHSILVESDFPGDFVDPAAEGRSELGDDEEDVEVRFRRGLASDPRAEHSEILDLHTLREALPQLPDNLTVRSVHSGLLAFLRSIRHGCIVRACRSWP